MNREELTVEQLIEKLKQFPPDMPVMTDHDETFSYFPVGDENVRIEYMHRNHQQEQGAMFGGPHSMIDINEDTGDFEYTLEEGTPPNNAAEQVLVIGA